MGRRREINVVNDLLTSIHSKASNAVTLNTTKRSLVAKSFKMTGYTPLGYTPVSYTPPPPSLSINIQNSNNVYLGAPAPTTPAPDSWSQLGQDIDGEAAGDISG